jgi:hypothetical protein
MVTDSLKSESEKLYKKYKLSVYDDGGECEGILITIDIDLYYLIINNRYLTHNTLAHEIYHATVKITEQRGIIDEEAQAWFNGHIAEVVYRFLDKKKLEVKHGRK